VAEQLPVGSASVTGRAIVLGLEITAASAASSPIIAIYGAHVASLLIGAVGINWLPGARRPSPTEKSKQNNKFNSISIPIKIRCPHCPSGAALPPLIHSFKLMTQANQNVNKSGRV